MQAVTREELKAICETAERFSAGELEPSVPENDRYPFSPFDRRAVEAAVGAGLLGLTISESRGGSGLGLWELSAVLRIVAAREPSFALLIFAQCLGYELLARCGLSALVGSWATAPRRVEDLLALPLYCDPEDLPLEIQARPVEGGFELAGSLGYVACLPVAGAAVIPAVWEGRLDLFLVETGRPGVLVGDPVVSLGLRGCPAADLTLENAHVPLSRRLCDEGGRMYAEAADQYRAPLAAIALGILEGSHAAARAYAEIRYQAKKQIIDHDMVRRMLARMQAWIDLGGAGVRAACDATERGEAGGGTLGLSIQELLSKAVARAVTDGVQILGGYGYMREYGQEKRMRDAKQLQGVFGSSDARTMRIADRGLKEI